MLNACCDDLNITMSKHQPLEHADDFWIRFMCAGLLMTNLITVSCMQSRNTRTQTHTHTHTQTHTYTTTHKHNTHTHIKKTTRCNTSTSCDTSTQTKQRDAAHNVHATCASTKANIVTFCKHADSNFNMTKPLLLKTSSTFVSAIFVCCKQ